MQEEQPQLTRYNYRLSWVAWALLAAWSSVAVLFAGYEFASRAIEAHGLSRDPVWQSPFPTMLGPTLWLLWLLATIYLAPAGLVVGLISVARQRSARAMRVAVLCFIVVGAVVAEFAAPSLTRDNTEVGHDFVHDGRLAALLVIVVALAAAGATFWVLPRSQRSPSLER